LDRPRADTADVVIIGGGAIGCSIAFDLAGRGHQVLVIERDQPGRAATWAAAGMLSPLGETPPESTFASLARASLLAYPAFLSRITDASGAPVEFAAPGKLEVAFDEKEASRLRAFCAVNKLAFLAGENARGLVPVLSERVTGAAHFPDDALVDPRALGQSLWRACIARGVRFRLGETVTAVRADGAAVSGVATFAGEIGAAKVVLAAGAWSGAIEGITRPAAVMPVRGQMLALQCSEPPFGQLLQSDHCYLIPRAGARVLVGATVERVGFDPRTTAEGVQGLLHAAIEMVPALSQAELSEVWTGFRPGTPDDLPILGADPGIVGLYYATGHYRNGILLAPITAKLVADLIEGKPATFDLAEFRPNRFSDSDERNTEASQIRGTATGRSARST
jgi:glycine oxidase